MSSKRDYYEVLGVSKSASPDEIKRSYRKLAKQYHPDTPTGDENKFKEITEAYEILSDDTKRRQYDQFGHNFSQGGSGFSGFQGFSDIFSDMFSRSNGGGGFSDIFSDIFGGNRKSQNSNYSNQPLKGESILLSLTLKLKDYIFGKSIKEKIKLYRTCTDCNGIGAESKKDIVKCNNCKGYGVVNSIQSTPFGQIQSQTECNSCHGKGNRILNACKCCKGNKVIIKNVECIFNIPRSSPLGQRIILREQGHDGINGGRRGDVVIELNVLNDKHFKMVNNYDLFLELPVNYLDMLLGEEIEIPTFDGNKKYKLSSSTNNNEELVLNNCGLFKASSSSKRGNLIVKLTAAFPKKMSSQDKKLLLKIKENSDFGINLDKFNR